MNDQRTEEHVRVLVYNKSVDGYPPEEWEGLWAIPLGADRFKLDNIPFYAKNLSCDDIIEAKLHGDDYIFQRVISPSENSTIRVVLYDIANEDDLRSDLHNLGCSIEGTGTLGLIAVNVPKENVEPVLDILEAAFAEEKLDFDEGALR